MATPAAITCVRQEYEALAPLLHEEAQRRWAACEALALGRGGISLVSVATGLSRPTIRRGLAGLATTRDDARGIVRDRTRIRRPGAGRPRLTAGDRSLLDDLRRLVDPATRGDPMSPPLWTCKGTRHLAQALGPLGHDVSRQRVARLLTDLGYDLQANRKTEEGEGHPDRDAQFEHIDREVRSFPRRGQPVVSAGTKEEELIGNSKDPGREWEPEGQPRRVKSKDSPDKAPGKVAPCGVYDLTANQGWVNVGITHDTAGFAVGSIRRRWSRMGSRVYPSAKEWPVPADSGGSDGCRTGLWEVCLQELADELGLKAHVCHFPPGTSEWGATRGRKARRRAATRRTAARLLRWPPSSPTPTSRHLPPARRA